MIGRVAIVTGANCGLGFEVSKRLCAQGHDVILACRNEERGMAAVEKICSEQGNALASYMHLDLADMSSVHKFVTNFHEMGKPLDLLVNNAGVFHATSGARRLTKDNFEATMGINHLGHFLLTHLLLEDLISSAKENGESRIVNVGSSLHDPALKVGRHESQPIDLDNFFLEKPGTYNGYQAYKNSKLANVLFTYELAERLRKTGVTVNCVCPGFVPETSLGRDAGAVSRFFLNYVLYYFLRYKNIAKTVGEGADAIMDCATRAENKEVTGKFFKDRKEAKSSTESMDETLRQKVWDMSVLYCHLQDKILPPPALAIPKKTRVRISVTPSPEEEETEIDQPKLYNPGKLKA